MTLLQFINYYLLQWFCIRLTKHYRTVIDEIDILEYSIGIYGGGVGGKIKKSHEEKCYSIQYWVLPMSG